LRGFRDFRLFDLPHFCPTKRLRFFIAAAPSALAVSLI
jgi:hypothetical protein